MLILTAKLPLIEETHPKYEENIGKLNRKKLEEVKRIINLLKSGKPLPKKLRSVARHHPLIDNYEGYMTLHVLEKDEGDIVLIY
jgi:mRNA-degrading endonuclease YafQ of YafQ-DinJ toxin-antitoxin module